MAPRDIFLAVTPRSVERVLNSGKAPRSWVIGCVGGRVVDAVMAATASALGRA